MIKSKGFYNYAWSVIEGCKNGCGYCYARKEIKDFNNPVFYEKRLSEPYLIKKSVIFVNPYSDIMGEWIPSEWIEKVIKVCSETPHDYIFMTKNPIRYYKFKFPDNCILGVTIESPHEWWRAKIMEELSGRKMASLEPILGSFKGYDFSQFELVIVGCLLGKWDYRYYDSVEHPNIYFKRRRRPR